MDDHLDALREAARDVAAKHLPQQSAVNAELDLELWNELETMGFIGLAADEAVGGSDGSLFDAAIVLRELATTRIPYAEAAFVAAPACSEAAVEIPLGEPFTAAAATTLERSGTRLSGDLEEVPYARSSSKLVFLVVDGEPELFIIDLQQAGVTIIERENLAGEPRDRVQLNDAEYLVRVAVSPDFVTGWRLREALSRAVMIAAVSDSVVAQTSQYVSERIQFGRALRKFQVIQHSLARMAADSTMMQVTAMSAVTSLRENGGGAIVDVAVAKAECAALVRPLTAAAHQAHGAIGFTQEHRLGSLTTRLWAWREEYGNERFWHERISDIVRQSGSVWDALTR